MTLPETKTQNDLGPVVARYDAELQANLEGVEALVEGLERAAINWAPEEGRWSIAQCLDHMAVVNEKYERRLARGIREAAAKGLAARDDSMPKLGFLEKIFLKSMEPPPRRALKAPKVVIPQSDHHPEDILRRYRASVAALRALLPEADGLDLGKAKMVSPLANWLKLRIGSAYSILASHDRRHFWQARQVRGHAEFPAAD